MTVLDDAVHVRSPHTARSFATAVLAAATCCTAWGQALPATAAASASPVEASPLEAVPAPNLIVGRQSQWQAASAVAAQLETASDAPGFFQPRLSVVALPPDEAPGQRPSRPHHALNVRSDAPRKLLQSIGIEASDCSMQFRMPAHFSQTSGGGLTLEARAQARLACRF